MEGVLNSVVHFEVISNETKFVILSKGLLIVILVENGHLGAMLFLGLSNGLLSDGGVVLLVV